MRFIVLFLVGMLTAAAAHAEVVSLTMPNKLVARAEYLAGQPGKPAVLILHGFLQTHEFPTVSRLANALHSAGYKLTIEEHRPKAHKKHLQWTPSRLIHWAGKVGPHCAKLVEHILKNRPHPEMGYRSVMGIMRLGKGLGDARLEAACRRALHFGTCTYRSIQSILENQLERQPLEQHLPWHSPSHENIRGQNYYNPPPPQS